MKKNAKSANLQRITISIHINRESTAMMINVISIIILTDTHSRDYFTNHFFYQSGGIEMNYLHCSEEGCSWKSSSCSYNDFPRNRQILAFDREVT